MRDSSFGYLTGYKESNLTVFGSLLMICLALMTGYLMGSERYLFSVILLFAALFPLTFFVNLEIIIYLLVISIPFSKFVIFSLDKIAGSLGNVPVHSSHILALLLIVIAIPKMMLGKREIRVDISTIIEKALLLVVFAYFVSILGVFQAYHDFIEYFKSMANMLLFATLYFAFTNSITRQDTIVRILKIWIFVSLFIALYGIYQFLNYSFPFLPLIPGTELRVYAGLPRIQALMPEPVEFVLYTAQPLLFMFALVAGRQTFPFKTLKANSLALFILLTAFLLSFAITGYLYLFLFVLLFSCSSIASLRHDLQKRWLPVSILSVPVIVGLFTGTGRTFLSRLSSVLARSDPSAAWRVRTASAAWQSFLKHPLFGIGVGNFAFDTGIEFVPAITHVTDHSDSLSTQILAEMGVVGFIAIALFFGVLLISLRKVIRLNAANDLNLHISRGLYFMLLTYVISTLLVSGWLTFWAWFSFSIIGSWVKFEDRRLREID
jgi:O-antigen ligase